jgi:hypothetical protein
MNAHIEALRGVVDGIVDDYNRARGAMIEQIVAVRRLFVSAIDLDPSCIVLVDNTFWIETGGGLRIRLLDDGTVAVEDPTYFFDPFYRAEVEFITYPLQSFGVDALLAKADRASRATHLVQARTRELELLGKHISGAVPLE